MLALVRPWVGGTGLLDEDGPRAAIGAPGCLIPYVPVTVMHITAGFNRAADFRSVRKAGNLGGCIAIPTRVIVTTVIGSVSLTVKPIAPVCAAIILRLVAGVITILIFGVVTIIRRRRRGISTVLVG
jgi:hypothetical protein